MRSLFRRLPILVALVALLALPACGTPTVTSRCTFDAPGSTFGSCTFG